MPTVVFEGDTHGEIVQQVRRWLASQEHWAEHLTPSQAIDQGAEITKDALRIIASAAPGTVGRSDLVKGLTAMGYKVTDATAQRAVEGLHSVETLTGGSVIKTISQSGRRAVFEMNLAVAKQVLKALTGV